MKPFDSLLKVEAGRSFAQDSFGSSISLAVVARGTALSEPLSHKQKPHSCVGVGRVEGLREQDSNLQPCGYGFFQAFAPVRTISSSLSQSRRERESLRMPGADGAYW